MLTVPEYGQLLERVGFVDVQAIDKTSLFMDILQIELKRFMEQKSGFLEQFKESDFEYIVEGWKSKLERCGAGDQAWGLFTATKPH